MLSTMRWLTSHTVLIVSARVEANILGGQNDGMTRGYIGGGGCDYFRGSRELREGGQLTLGGLLAMRGLNMPRGGAGRVISSFYQPPLSLLQGALWVKSGMHKSRKWFRGPLGDPDHQGGGDDGRRLDLHWERRRGGSGSHEDNGRVVVVVGNTFFDGFILLYGFKIYTRRKSTGGKKFDLILRKF